MAAANSSRRSIKPVAHEPAATGMQIDPERIVNSNEFEYDDFSTNSIGSPSPTARATSGSSYPSLDVVIPGEELVDKEWSVKERREDARGRLAVLFTVATFVLFVLGFFLAIGTEGDKVNNLKEIFITISGTFSGLLGFVIGYYFRSEEDR